MVFQPKRGASTEKTQYFFLGPTPVIVVCAGSAEMRKQDPVSGWLNDIHITGS